MKIEIEINEVVGAVHEVRVDGVRVLGTLVNMAEGNHCWDIPIPGGFKALWIEEYERGDDQ